MIKSQAPNVREMLLNLGVGSFVADIAIPFVWFTPGTIDPDSASVIEIIRALQRGLRKLGYRQVRVSGGLDRATARALDQVSGPPGAWMQKALIQILGDVSSALKDPDRAMHKIEFRGGGLGGYFTFQGTPPGPLPGLPPGPLGMGATAEDAGIALEFGLGVRDKTNIVPIPKSSGGTFAAFKNLQRQINRALSTIPNGGRISEDGIIGGGTLVGLRKIKSAMGFLGGLITVGSTLSVAERSVTIANALDTFADQRGAPPKVNIGSSVTNASISEPTPPPVTSQQVASIQRSASIKKFAPLLLIAGVGGVAWFATQKKRKKGKR